MVTHPARYRPPARPPAHARAALHAAAHSLAQMKVGTHIEVRKQLAKRVQLLEAALNQQRIDIPEQSA